MNSFNRSRPFGQKTLGNGIDPMTGLSWAQSMKAPGGSAGSPLMAGRGMPGMNTFRGLDVAYPMSQGGTGDNVLTRLIGMNPRSWMPGQPQSQDDTPFGQWFTQEKIRLGMMPNPSREQDPLAAFGRSTWDNLYSLLR